jgi:hypothetical protein
LQLRFGAPATALHSFAHHFLFSAFLGLREGEAVLSRSRNRIIAPSWQAPDSGAPNRSVVPAPPPRKKLMTPGWIYPIFKRIV